MGVGPAEELAGVTTAEAMRSTRSRPGARGWAQVVWTGSFFDISVTIQYHRRRRPELPSAGCNDLLEVIIHAGRSFASHFDLLKIVKSF